MKLSPIFATSLLLPLAACAAPSGRPVAASQESALELLTPASAGREESGSPQEATASSDEDWRFVLAPYAWLLSVDGSANIAGQDLIVDEDFGDIFDKINFVAEARFEAWKDDWGLLLDLTYAEIGNDFELGPLQGETESELTLAFLGGMYRFVEQQYADAPGGITVDGMAGIAISSLEGELDFDSGLSLDGGEDIVDPFVGLRTRWAFNEKWGASLETLIGGLELFDGSDLITMSSVLVGRKISANGHLYFGWRTLDLDYENDEDGNDRFDLNLNMNGPIIGYEWSF